MIFTRTAHGIANYHLFYNVDLIFFIEGEQLEYATFDEMYYEAILPMFTNGKSIKVKPVGNKIDALEYFQKISNEQITNSIVIVDKDLYGISTSLVASNELLTTYGYSWENDFWTPKLCEAIINTINPIKNNNILPITVLIEKTMRRVLKISAIDVALQSNAVNLLKKNGKSCGINISCNEPYMVSCKEYNRHSNLAKSKGFLSCKVALDIYRSAVHSDPCKVINGHLWEYVCITIISRRYNNASKRNTKINPDIIKNIAFTTFKSNPKDFLNQSCLNHFKQQFSRLGY